MKLKINLSDEEVIEVSVFSIRNVELVHYDMMQISFHDGSVKELQFWPIETAQERAKHALDILTQTFEINASSVKPLFGPQS